jgi:cytosine permease
MYVNNEIGVKQNIEALGKLIKANNPKTYFHVDAVQGFGKYAINVERENIDLLSISGHKIHAPKGIGALYVKKGVKINPIVLVIIAGICMTSSAYFGMKGLEIVSYIAVPLIAVLGIYSMVAATITGGGLSAIFSKSTGSITIFTGVGMVIGSFVSGGTSTPNFVRFAKTNKMAVITTIIAFFLGNTLMFAFGAVGGAFTGKDDIFYVLIAQGLAIPAILVLGANIWTTNDNALYTSGLGLSNITKFKKRPMVLIAGLIGTVTAIWLYNNFIGWLSFLNATLPPIGAIIALDFYMHRENYSEKSTVEKKFNFGAIVGVAAGALAGNFIPLGIAAINAIVVACACFLFAELTLQKQSNRITIEG